MYKKLNDRHKHKTAYLQCVQYLDGSYRLSLLLKLIFHKLIDLEEVDFFVRNNSNTRGDNFKSTKKIIEK